MDALILAGGESSPELQAATGATERALIPVGSNDEPMIAPVVRAIRAALPIARIAVAGSTAVHAAARAHSEIIAVEGAERMTQNLANGARALQAETVLVCTCDVPFLTQSTLEEFVRGAHSLDIAYAVVRRAVCEAAFPGGKRTYARLVDGEFTGGNAVLLPRARIDDLVSLAETAYNARKNPAKLAGLLGAGLMVKFATRRLKISDIEARASAVLGCRAGAVEMQDAAIAFDVDKLEDWETVRRLSERIQ
ncbi:MAG TPA: NTP transferase domain-containing protein [Abditibacteriaceae bacterium]|jgi:GTP:adenosylcobinamide-phosphate guanylyltransferase